MSAQYVHIHTIQVENPAKLYYQTSILSNYLTTKQHKNLPFLYDFPPVSPYSNVDFVHHSCSYEPSS